MTKLNKAALTTTIVLVILIGTAIASFAVNTGTVKEEAKLRKTASDDSIILEIIPNNEEVEILEADDGWYKVNYKKIKGYVKKEFIESKEEVKDAETNTIQETNEVTKGNADEEQSLKKGAVVIIKNNTSLYLRPLINSKVKNSIEQNKNAEIIALTKKWAYVNTESGIGWVKLDDISTKEQAQEKKSESNKTETTSLNKTGYISSSGINFRKEPNTDSEILRVFVQNASVKILEETGDWYKVTYKDQTGYVLKTYVSDKKQETTSRSAESRKKSTNQAKTEDIQTITTSSSGTEKGKEIANYAKQFVGKKYVYGGSSPSGFDCSGLTMYVYKKFGISLPHSATSQSKLGVAVSKSNLQPGDLVFFTNYRTGKGIGHVGVYIGSNKFVHASTEKTGVITSSLSGSGYAKRYVKAVRLVK